MPRRRAYKLSLVALVVLTGAWGVSMTWQYGTIDVLILPVWLPFLIVSIPTLALWPRDRIPPGHCKACRYDLTGNVSGVCPECGTNTGDG